MRCWFFGFVYGKSFLSSRSIRDVQDDLSATPLRVKIPKEESIKDRRYVVPPAVNDLLSERVTLS
ncbi:MAG: hypothetical protein MJA30_38170 [Cytophagales bacterium]|nr:hypothetical protein [Cytophagales bacterium]